ncbi:hypothetical protein Anas_10160 [Armadillidium nasatum]|uniref:Uncharacterized protein n=1 Tax=Armadillidium nasatum TaxID=96803 RepID=A0A5N5SJC4_9CRUS|nr:hypothetical protein Anas_10160 [Armadillidium nasatum]
MIGEYWSEIDTLRQDLLVCQLGSKNFPHKNNITPKISSVMDNELTPTISDRKNILPFPQLLKSNPPKVQVKSRRLSSITERSVDNLEVITAASVRPQSTTPISIIRKTFVNTTSKPNGTELQDTTNVSNTSSDENFSGEDKMVCLSEKYVNKLEKRSSDLSARVAACRKCLDPSHLKETKCGGGISWREFKRKERLARRKVQKEKRKRKKKEKETSKELENENEMESTTEFVLKEETTTTGKPLSDVSQIFGYQLNRVPSKSAQHQMRQNHRVSTDFRRSFNQKILRMDEALMQFTETQSAFCKELRDNLGGNLKKRGQELEALSEQIAALVRTTTAQVAMIEKLTSDQVQTGQSSIEKNLANLQVLREDQVRSFKNFHKTVFLPAMVTLTSLLGEQASAVTNMAVDIITKVEMLQDIFRTFSTRQRDSFKKITEEVDMFMSKHGNLITRSRDHAKHLHLNTENFIRELQTRMNNVVKELVLVRLQSQTFISINENTFHEISASLNKTEDVVSTLSEDLHRRVEIIREEEGDFSNDFKQETDLISSRTENGVSEVLMRNHAAISQIGETELDTRAFSNNGEAAWNEMYDNQETELRQEADMLANKLRSQTHHTQNILSGLRGTASTHEQVLEQQRTDFQGFIRKRQDALDSQCSSISDWALLMSSELRNRDEDLHRFLNEELRLSPAIPSSGVTERNEYHVSSLPNESLSHGSSSSSSTTPDILSTAKDDKLTNVTSHITEASSERENIQSSVTSEGNRSIPLLNAILFPYNSSHSESSSSVNLRETSRPLSSIEELGGPVRGDLSGVSREDSPESLSNDIKILGNFDEFDNKIQQNDQAFGCNIKPKFFLPQ